jgi:hypothetical protein
MPETLLEPHRSKSRFPTTIVCSPPSAPALRIVLAFAASSFLRCRSLAMRHSEIPPAIVPNSSASLFLQLATSAFSTKNKLEICVMK